MHEVCIGEDIVTALAYLWVTISTADKRIHCCRDDGLVLGELMSTFYYPHIHTYNETIKLIMHMYNKQLYIT